MQTTPKVSPLAQALKDKKFATKSSIILTVENDPELKIDAKSADDSKYYVIYPAAPINAFPQEEMKAFCEKLSETKTITKLCIRFSARDHDILELLDYLKARKLKHLKQLTLNSIVIADISTYISLYNYLTSSACTLIFNAQQEPNSCIPVKQAMNGTFTQAEKNLIATLAEVLAKHHQKKEKALLLVDKKLEYQPATPQQQKAAEPPKKGDELILHLSSSPSPPPTPPRGNPALLASTPPTPPSRYHFSAKEEEPVKRDGKLSLNLLSSPPPTPPTGDPALLAPTPPTPPHRRHSH